ncbi:hypothetical protein OESDEN_04942 [Oesophagostomum dentatum]|uniref:Uncharacterized protein n=1 Tax=Oesophagostomum dentatum TaxID=61180 RepID=A0A0B1TH42_OESDE|nr:hypothetical protein OESDEN_04942 [Oesophagostomum dentatum]
MLDYRIIEQITNWNAPMSLTVVIRNIQRYGCTMNFLRQIQRDFPPVAKYLRAHLVFAQGWSENCTIPPTGPEPAPTMCEKTNASIEQIALYPANLARNVARMVGLQGNPG